VVIYDAAAREPVECIQTSPGAGGARQAHAAVPAPDGSYILVANQNGKPLERIDADFSADQFTLNGSSTLNLATCITPNGAPCESVALRPDNAPICPVVDGSGRRAFVTLRGGGLLKFARDRFWHVDYDRHMVVGVVLGGRGSGSISVTIDSLRVVNEGVVYASEFRPVTGTRDLANPAHFIVVQRSSLPVKFEEIYVKEQKAR
jgi:hypothetical protein